ncbi:MAG: prepilin-type N-terminal cleavage/methylation domain-containing protein [Clostridia bacterium]|nr:prepilin-type N-terminal cleavage/methylation domain-containing protein [Clostridia bacterium]
MTNRKKGFTLVELVITLTLTALVSGMIVSFCVLINDRVKKNSRMTTQLEELTFLRTLSSAGWLNTTGRTSALRPLPARTPPAFFYTRARAVRVSLYPPRRQRIRRELRLLISVWRIKGLFPGSSRKG